MAATAHNPMHWPYHVVSGLNVDKTEVFEGPDARDRALEYAQRQADATGWSAYVHKGRPGSMVVGKGKKIRPTTQNPAVSAEQYRLAQAVLSGTARDTRMSVKAAREIVEKTPARLRSEYSKNPFYGEDLDRESLMVPAWKYYDSKKARDMDARLKEGAGKKVVLGYSIFGFKEGGGKKWRMRLADHRGNPKKRPNDVDGNPVPQNYDVVSIRRNSGDALDVKNALAVANIPSAIVEPGTTTFGQSTGNWTVWTPKKTYKRAVKLAEKAYFDRYPERMKNPQSSADDMYASFHGEPSDETIDLEHEEHYHSHLAALGELVELKVKLVNGGTAVIGFENTGSGEEVENPSSDSDYYWRKEGNLYVMRQTRFKGRLAKGEEHPHDVMAYARTPEEKKSMYKLITGRELPEEHQQQNPFWPFNSFTHTTIYHVGTGEKYTKKGDYKGYALYQKNDTGEFLVPALDKESRFDTKKDAQQFVNAWTKHTKNPKHRGPFHAAGKLIGKGTKAVSRPVDDFISTAGKVGGYLDDELGRALNPGPGTDFSLYNAAMQADEAFQKALVKEYGKRAGDMRYRSSQHPPHIKHLAQIKQAADERWLNEMRRKKNPSDHPTGPVYLASNEEGTQLYIIGGDQSLDLPGLNINGAQADKELVTIGQVTNVVYHTHKIFDGEREEYDYTHKLSEDTHGPLPVLIYDRINQQLKLSGGVYHIPRPLMDTSPGITD